MKLKSENELTDQLKSKLHSKLLVTSLWKGKATWRGYRAPVTRTVYAIHRPGKIRSLYSELFFTFRPLSWTV